MEDKARVTVLYLGRRGGGAKITKKISEDLQTSDFFFLSAICIRKDNEEVKEYDQSRVIQLFDRLNSITTLLKILKYTFVPKKLLSDMHLTENGTCVVPMVSPLGLIVEGLIKIQGVNVIRLLHDFEKHPGDKWPPSWLNRRIVKQSDVLIALSEEVARKVKILNPKIRVSIYPHPAFDFSTSPIQMDISSRYILFIGRIRKYKGVENLISAFANLASTNVELIIAGEGDLRLKNSPNTKVINRWLEEHEISSLIKNAEAVVFPYIEASQSGLLPYCVSQNKKVVITPLPGLLEQTKGYANTFITETFEIEKLRFAISAAINAQSIVQSSEKPKTVSIEKALLESGIFSKKFKFGEDLLN
jgi:glycosyltransferase involved in cell wall biosynthesis